MLPSRVHLWKLGDGGSRSLALSCTGDGLFLGGTPLIERRGVRYELRPRVELERLFVRAGRAESEIDRLLPGFRVVAAALDERDLSLAQIAAVQLRVSDLPDEIARRSLAAEDRLIKAERDEMLARAGWDPSEHPRAGVPPNPGWFAPTGGSSAAGAVVVAQGEEDERAPEELLDPAAPLRQAQWDAAIARLRAIDPQNPNLSYIANPGTAPSQAALDRLDAALEAAAVKRVSDKVMPGGVPIGQPGSSPDISELPGGSDAARKMFDYLRVGTTPYDADSNMTIVKLPGNGVYITFRQISRSGGPAIDINVEGISLKRIHF